MSLKEELKKAIPTALKAGEKIKVQTLRALQTEIQYEEMSKNLSDLPEQDLTTLLKREVKKREEALEYEIKAARDEAVAQLKEELEIIKSYLPQQLSEAQLKELILKIKNAGAENMGAIMKALKEGYAGQYDAKQASEIAKSI